MKRICVVGSLNMDLVASVDRFPKSGETLAGLHFGSFPGGKGANQAVAAARLGARVHMAGKVGNDPYGSQYLTVLDREGINRDMVKVDDLSTGVALIEVNAEGENRIVIVAGANGAVTSEYIAAVAEALDRSDIFLLQLEIPFPTVTYILRWLKRRHKTVILDPAPAQALDSRLLRQVTYLTPNETELALLTGMETDSLDGICRAAAHLAGIGACTVIAKAGSRGAFIAAGDECVHVPGFKVRTVDTTAAGDTFNGALATALAQEQPLEDCVRFANAAAALSTTAMGAQPGMPSADAVCALLGDKALGGGRAKRNGPGVAKAGKKTRS